MTPMPPKLREVVRLYAGVAVFGLIVSPCTVPFAIRRFAVFPDPVETLGLMLPTGLGIAMGITAFFVKRRQRWAWRAAIGLAIALIFGILFVAIVAALHGGILFAPLLLPCAAVFVVALVYLLRGDSRTWFPDPHTGLIAENPEDGWSWGP